MSQLCQRCRRLNPQEAVYCYFDGALLDGNAHGNGPVLDVGTLPFPTPFVFPSGRTCANFNQLALACCDEREAAHELLRRGGLESFVAALGRRDLADAAHAAAQSPDRARGLDDFLGHLPVAGLLPAKLRVESGLIDLGTLRPGENRRCELVLHNQGLRLLYGLASRDHRSSWLSLGDGSVQKRKLFQFTERTVLPFRILGDRLRANTKPQQAEIRLESNGGSATVLVRVQVAVQPFPQGVLAGVVSPRQAVEKIVAAPHEASALIENGAVARWYRANGWDYPVLGPAASGFAAVQQLLEALGKAQPPRVELGDESVSLSGHPGQTLEHVLPVITHQNRAVVAFGSSDQSWLCVGPTIFRGRCAFLPLTVPAVPACPGQTLSAQVTVTANGGQRFLVPVALVVRLDSAPAAPPEKRSRRRASKQHAVPAPSKPAPVALSGKGIFDQPTVVIEPASSRGPSNGRRLSRRLLILVCMLAGGALLGLGLHLFFRWASSNNSATTPTDSLLTVEFQDDPQDRVGTAMMTFGLILPHEPNPDDPRQHKRLTFDARGRTNNTCYRLDGKEVLLGYEGGAWQTLASNDPRSDGRSVWLDKIVPVAFTQTVEIVTGSQSGQRDTCLIRYTIENRDEVAHKVGLRFLLNTFSGSRDSVPFAVPGVAQLCDTSCDLQGAMVPDFLESLETNDLSNPGVVAHLGLRRGEGLEVPGRITVGGWPDAKSKADDKRAQGNLTRWDVPLLSLKEQPDCAVTLYWPEEDLGPGARRKIGFTYGLGSLATDDAGRLALSVGGAFVPGGELTVAAYVKEPAKGETLTLDLPAGWELVGSKAVEPIPALPAAASWPISLVTWKVRSASDGPANGQIQVRTSTGASLARTVTIPPDRARN